MMQAMIGFWMQCHQLVHMQIICTSLQTDKQTNTSSLNFYRLEALKNLEQRKKAATINKTKKRTNRQQILRQYKLL